MTFSTGSFRDAAVAVCARDGVELVGLGDRELLGLSGEVTRARRDVEVLLAEVASEIRRRSVVDHGAGLASRQGFRSPEALIAHVTGGSVTQAIRFMNSGDLLAAVAQEGATQTEAATHSPLTVFRMELAGALREGHITVEVAGVFQAAVAGLPDLERTRDLFLKALHRAPGLPLVKVRALVWQAQAFADPVAWEARENRQHENRSVAILDDRDGMVTFSARLTPLAAAPVRAVLDAGVRWALQQRRDNPGSDTRSVWQIRADVFTDMCQHALDCSGSPTGVRTTVVVRMSLDDLRTGTGLGEIDGTSQPVSVSALRQAAADAEVIPVVLGGDSEILDWGRAKRLFTPAQRLALVERDGGCSWCNAPPSRCAAHHIRWWNRDKGPTDMNNGVLLCTRGHTRIHRDEWDITIHGQEVNFTPPTSIDPTRTPRPGGRHRHRIAA